MILQNSLPAQGRVSIFESFRFLALTFKIFVNCVEWTLVWFAIYAILHSSLANRTGLFKTMQSEMVFDHVLSFFASFILLNCNA
jgi:hypothetical protein